MYLEFFGLHERPFTITPDPRYLYMSERHAEALAHLIYGVTESDGFIVLTGEVGTGKTTLVRSLLQRMPAEADVALVLNPQLTAAEFLTVILKELDVPLPDEADSCRALTESLNTYLLDAHSRGRRTIAVVDEAQNLSAEVLEQIRLLTNLETARHKLLQIVLIGQPELRELLARSDLRQLAQRVTARYHLLPLSLGEATQYLDHRLSIAGALQPILLPPAKKRIHQLAQGIPRLMNLIADRALLGAWSREQREVDRRLVDAAAAEVFGSEPTASKPTRRWPQIAAVLATIAILAVTATAFLRDRVQPQQAVAVTAPVTTQIERVAAPVEPLAATMQEATPALPDLDEWLGQHRDRTGTNDAFSTLFETWRLDFDPEAGPACEQASANALRCIADRASLAELLLLDRPAIITLRDLAGESHQVLLSAHDGGDVLLKIPDGELLLPRSDLDRFWFGEYLLLWRPPNNQSVSFVPGMNSEGILWLRQSLTAILGRDIPPADSTRFDENLEIQVRNYQQARRLTVDGLVGQKTQMMINTDLGLDDIPRLSDSGERVLAARSGGTP